MRGVFEIGEKRQKQKKKERVGTADCRAIRRIGEAEKMRASPWRKLEREGNETVRLRVKAGGGKKAWEEAGKEFPKPHAGFGLPVYKGCALRAGGKCEVEASRGAEDSR